MICTYQKTPQGLVFHTGDLSVKIVVYGSAVFRVICTGDQEFSKSESLIVTMPCPDEALFSVLEHQDIIRISTESMMCDISKKTGAFTWRDKQGKLLTREPSRGGKTLNRVDVVKSEFSDDNKVTINPSTDGIKISADSIRQRVDRQAWQTKLEFEFKPDEALYGLGSHEEGLFNLRGTSQYLYQQNLKATVPVLISTEGYGVLFDSCSLMTFHDDQYGSYLWTDCDDQMDYYFVYGPDFDSIIGSLRGLTGSVPMLPRAAFGYIQSRERYKTAEELILIAEEYRRRKLPIDMIVLDWKSWTGNLWGQKSFDPVRFPDPDGMMKRLHELNVKLMVSIWPNMRQGGENHEEMLSHGFLLGNRSTYDAFNDDARALYWKQANEGLFSYGVDAWWCDSSEPFQADWGGPVKPEPEVRLAINTGESKKYLDQEYINAYSMMHSKGIYEGQRSVSSRKRVVNLTRSSYPGQHRYSTIVWSGDVSATWDTLKKQVPAALSFCVTGEPYWTLDIGAFFVGGKAMWSYWNSNPDIPAPWFLAGDYDKGKEDLGYRELYTRWFQFGAFLPIFRTHGTDTPREVWQFGEPGTMFYEAIVKVLRLRYRLMSYIYSLAGQVTHCNGTMLRLLAFDFISDKNVYNIADQYMFGPSILVCPVVEPMYYNPGSEPIENASFTRRVYLPSDGFWYDFQTGERFAGGQTIDVDCPIDVIPLFIKAGSILPFGPEIEYADQDINEPLEIRVYPGMDGAFALYEDEGDNYNYENGKISWIPFQWNDSEGILTVDNQIGGFKDMKQNRSFCIKLMGAKEKETMMEYNGNARSLHIFHDH